MGVVFVPRRLDKLLRDATTLSVVESREACLAGRVAVGPARGFVSVARSPELVIFEQDMVSLDGQVVTPRTDPAYLVLNKPRFVTATTRDPGGKTDLRPWLEQMPPGVFPVGRLDRETSGALLFTDDGDFANAILHPGHHTEKLYWLWLDEVLLDDDPRLDAFVQGVQRPTGEAPLRATSVAIAQRTADSTELYLTLDEGKKRHIRKMCHLLGLRLLQLHRKAIGSLALGDLAIGEWRCLQPAEVEALWESAGSRALVTQSKIAALARMANALQRAGCPNERLMAWLEEALVR